MQTNSFIDDNLISVLSQGRIYGYFVICSLLIVNSLESNNFTINITFGFFLILFSLLTKNIIANPIETEKINTKKIINSFDFVFCGFAIFALGTKIDVAIFIVSIFFINSLYLHGVVHSIAGAMTSVFIAFLSHQLLNKSSSLEFFSYSSIYLNFTAALGLTLFISVFTFHLKKQASELISAKEALLKQQENALQVSRKLVKYLPLQVWESIFSGKRDARILNYRKKLSVFFSDIKDFTSTTDEMSSDELTEMLNHYFEQMSKIAIRYGGTIDKFIGDAMLVFFGDPQSNGIKEDAINCVSMAIDMRKQMQVLRQKWNNMGVEKPLHIRMGITTGYCHVGNFGCEARMDYTIIGRDANLASRLQNAADVDEILISDETYMLIRDRIICREKGTIKLRGINDAIKVWQVLDFRSDLGAKTTWIEHEHDGFSLLIDTNKVKNYEKEKIIQHLESAAKCLKEKNIV